MKILFAILAVAAYSAFGQQYVGVYGNETNGSVLPLSVEARIAEGINGSAAALERANDAYGAATNAIYLAGQVASGTDSNAWHIGDVVTNASDEIARAAAASNAAAIVANGALASNAYAAATNAQATANGAFAAYSNLPYIPTNAIGITELGGLVDGGRGNSLTITNFGAYNISGKAVGNRNVLNVYSPDIGQIIGRVNVGGDLIVSNRAYFMDGIYTNLMIDGQLNVMRYGASTAESDVTMRVWNGGNAEFDIDMRNESFPFFSIETEGSYAHYTVDVYGDVWLTHEIFTGQVSAARGTIYANPNATTVTIGGVSRTNWPIDGTDGGWTNLAFSGIGNAVTGATATGTTLTLQRGTIEGGTGTVSGASATAEGDVLVYAWKTNIALVAGTNLYAQRIASIDGLTTLTLPAKTSTNQSATIWLTIPAPATATNTVAILTNSPPVYGYVPTVSTSAVSELIFRSVPGSSNWWVRRIR